ncbi:MAG: DUF4118 domain-containing protein, partial [Candidatus Eremiobacterota bacterium]
MTENSRADPDELLAVVQAEEQRKTRGKLKIFLGYCAGVGKTYAMLEAARHRKEEGVDVVVGWVDTHGRQETAALLEGLEVTPRMEVEYRGVDLKELDLDRVLQRKPRLALVDELAHTNAPGSRHRKRWQDVDEILREGIDVYTTLNIQHIESLNDVVSQITRVRVRETLPDRILDQADEIELIDLPPEELLQRLKEGKVYVPEQAQRAVLNFFAPAKLAALRELVLRRAADQVDADMRSHMRMFNISGPWAAAERLLVAVGPSPFGPHLVRSAKRLAVSLKAPWEALYVESSDQLSEEALQRVERTLELAESLGARVVRLSGSRVSEAVLEYARSHNITKIVLGKPTWKQRPWKATLVDDIIRGSGAIDVYVITAEGEHASPESRVAPKQEWGGYAYAAGLVCLTTVLGQLADPYVPFTNLVMFYLLAVVMTALRHGERPAALAATMSVVTFNFFFVPPRHTFAVADSGFLITFAALLLVGLVIG